MIYLVSFIISSGFAFLASRTENKKKIFIFSLFSIAIMVALAGLRDYSIGKDTMNYYLKNQYWNGAITANSLLDYLKSYFKYGYGEPLFAIMIGVIAKVTGKYYIFLFISHLIIITLMYIGVFRFKKIIDPSLALLVFYLLFYNNSLNILRQYIAMAIVFVFLADIQEKKIWRLVIAIFFATLFHTTVIISLIIPVLYFALYTDFPKFKIDLRQRKIYILALISGLILFFSPIVNLFINIGLLSEKYLFFINNKSSPAIIVMGMTILCIISADYYREQIQKKCGLYDFYFMGSSIYLILLLLTYILIYGRRISLYLAIVDIITVCLIESCQTNERKRKIIRFIILFIATLYWVYTYVLTNNGLTFPYKLGF